MPSARVVEAVDVLEERGLSLSACAPVVSPNEFSLQGFEECLDGCIIVAISFPAHRRVKVLLAQDLLIVMTAILAPPVGMMNASGGRLS